MVFLLLAILCSTAISVLMRISTGKAQSNFTMLAVNYFVCALLSAAYAGFDLLPVQTEGFGLTVALGLVSGGLYLGGFVMLQSNTKKNGIVLTSVFMKLGLLVSVTVSVVCFGEIPSWLQITGFILALASILLINLQKGGQNRFGFGLLLLLLLSGGSDAMSKVFANCAPVQLESQYLFYTFLAAFLLCLIPVLANKERPQWTSILFGIGIGIPNFFSAKFLLAALQQLDAVVVYPSFCVGTLLLVTLFGLLVFRERLRPRQWVAVAGILIALLLLNI